MESTSSWQYTFRSQLLLQPSQLQLCNPLCKSNFNNQNPTPLTNHCPRIVHHRKRQYPMDALSKYIRDDPSDSTPIGIGACNLSTRSAMFFGVATAEPCEFSLCISASAAQRSSIHDGGGVPGCGAGWESASTSLNEFTAGKTS